MDFRETEYYFIIVANIIKHPYRKDVMQKTHAQI